MAITSRIDNHVNTFAHRDQIIAGLETSLNERPESVAENIHHHIVNMTIELVSSLVNETSPIPCAEHDEDGNIHLSFWKNHTGVSFTIFTNGNIQGVIENDDDGIVTEKLLSIAWRENDELFEFRKTLDQHMRTPQPSDDFADIFN